MSQKLRDTLKGKLTKEELECLPSSFDVVGDILIFSDFPENLQNEEKRIGDEILKIHKNIKSVFKKIKKYSGKYRTPKLKLMAGQDKTETLHKENNSMFKLDAEKVYFSVRLSTERKRIFQQVKKDESILILFSGIGVYPITIARNTPAKEINGIEINPAAHKYALENVILNKVESKVKLFLGDVKKVLPQINKKFDRVVMPLPKDAESFLNLVLEKTKKSGIVHFYNFADENMYSDLIQKIKKECKKQKKQCKILKITRCGQFSPKVVRICVDFRVS